MQVLRSATTVVWGGRRSSITTFIICLTDPSRVGGKTLLTPVFITLLCRSSDQPSHPPPRPPGPHGGLLRFPPGRASRLHQVNVHTIPVVIVGRGNAAGIQKTSNYFIALNSFPKNSILFKLPQPCFRIVVFIAVRRSRGQQERNLKLWKRRNIVSIGCNLGVRKLMLCEVHCSAGVAGGSGHGDPDLGGGARAGGAGGGGHRSRQGW